MMNLFSVFDPVSYFMMPLNWVIVFLIFIMVSLGYYVITVGYKKMIMSMFKGIESTLNDVASPNGLGMTFLCGSVFMYLMISNLLGLLPFVFVGTSYPMMTLGLSMVFWLTFFMMGWIKNFNYSCAHLVPEGSPMMLAPLLVLVESVSHLIRPFTLAIRLAANMMAGHLIVGLLSMISMLSFSGMISSILFQSMLLILELCVAVIQGFVFSILLLLYALEYY